MHRKALLRLAAVLSLSVTVGACGTLKEKFGAKDIDYKSARTGKPLEVPPDLSSTSIEDSLVIPGEGGTSYSAYQGARRQGPAATQVLPTPKNVHMERDGAQRWLVIDGAPERVWPRVRNFFLEKGFSIARENPRTGIIETDWAENRARVKSDFIRDFFSKFLGGLYSTGLRDKFRVRLERGVRPGTTELYLTHRGMVERVSEITGPDPVQTQWEPRPADPELEAEMLREIMVFLGVDRERARQVAKSGGGGPARAQLGAGTGGAPLLTLQMPFDRAWRRVGLALDRVGFTVFDRNRSEGVYYVRYIDTDVATKKKKGFIKRLFSRGGKKVVEKDEYQVRVRADGTVSRVQVTDEKGRPENSRIASRILNLLYDELK